ncbi:ArsR/SmtB family transcription factor [Poseidonocella sedimentorum]|uniref:DNA-binding transcriptional regulator, ArsR family n=1 Tax=Poseidonocella sedimentorum TaxID=871652 RepID=A0A1I6E0Q7_9RHOB|nr:metalloregulator ArsR/SmtB family transcription factor [Poseidonocella sedimentorum]SFR11374.1 DNA-binding transcriptional regulator, ArsR family [Poseidonocella sedimentorum]
MEKTGAISALAALAHELRIEIFRRLVKTGPEGLAAGALADVLGVRPNTLSNNLNVLAAAGLVRAAREGRSIRYFAEIDQMRALLGFLMEDCCGGDPALCQPMLAELSAPGGCSPTLTKDPDPT